MKARTAEELIVGIVLVLLIGYAWTTFWSAAWWRVKRTTKHPDSLFYYGVLVSFGLFILFEVIYFSTNNSRSLASAAVVATFGMAVLTIAALRTVNRRLLAKQPIT